MTAKKTARKTAAKKTASPKAPEPMDPGAREVETAEPIAHSERACYAARVLADEAQALFGAEVEYGNPNGRNVARDAYITSTEPGLRELMALVGSDERVESVDFDTHEDTVMVTFHNNPATYDDRSPFGLAQAHAILSDGGDLTLDDNDDFAVVEGDGESGDDDQ